MTFLRRSACLLAALAASCGRGGSGDDVPTRPFAMGFTPFPYDGNGNERPALSSWPAQAAFARR